MFLEKDNKTATQAEHAKLVSERSTSIHPDTLHIFLGMNFRQILLKAKDSFSSALSEAYQKTQQQCRKALSLLKNELQLPTDILPTHGFLHSLPLIKCTFYSKTRNKGTSAGAEILVWTSGLMREMCSYHLKFRQLVQEIDARRVEDTHGVSEEGPGFVSCPSNCDNGEIASTHLALSIKIVLLTVDLLLSQE